jgi:hypothetical protein
MAVLTLVLVKAASIVLVLGRAMAPRVIARRVTRAMRKFSPNAELTLHGMTENGRTMNNSAGRIRRAMSL